VSVSYRRRGARDANEPDIVAALEACGAFVVKLDQKDIPDLLVGYEGRWFVLEVKIPLGPKGGASDRVLSGGQIDFFAQAHRRRLPVTMVRTEKEALVAIGAHQSLLDEPARLEALP
jgi:hypothetical protein